MQKVILTPNPYRDKNFNTVRSAMEILDAAGLDVKYTYIHIVVHSIVVYLQ